MIKIFALKAGIFSEKVKEIVLKKTYDAKILGFLGMNQ